MTIAAPLNDHMSAAERAWETIHKNATEAQTGGGYVPSDIINSCRKDAAKTFWLYPLVEARRGIPGS